MSLKSFTVTYDKDSDVLYVHYKRVPAARGIEDDSGIVWRYDAEGELIGVTIVDYRDYWFDRREVLAHEISEKFDIPEKQARIVLDHARGLK